MYDADRFAIDEQRVVSRPRIQTDLAECDARPAVVKKLWTGREFKACRRTFETHREYILEVRLHETELASILPTVGYAVRRCRLKRIIVLPWQP